MWLWQQFKVVENREKSQKLEYGAILSSHNFVFKCSIINLEIDKALQLDVNNTLKELEDEIMRNP